MTDLQGRKIAIVGASGNIGTPTVKAILDKGVHTVTAISRTESSATFPSNVIVKKGDYNDEAFLVSALEGQDVLILQLGFTVYNQQVPLIKAAAKAGVRYVLPAEYGSDPYSSIAKNFDLVADKKRYRDLIEEVGMAWIAIVNNPWLDWSLEAGFWGVDVKNRKTRLFKGAEAKFNTTTLARVGEGVARLLSLPEAELEQFKNTPLYIKSVYITQRELYDSVLRVTNTKEKDWSIANEDANEAIEQSRKEVAAGDHFAFIKEFYIAHMTAGQGGDFNEKAEKDMKTLGLGEENLDEIVKLVVQKTATEA